MSDPQQYTVAQLAEMVQGIVNGDDSCQIHGVAAIKTAQFGQLTFVDNPKYLKDLKATRASAVIVSPEYADRAPVNAIVVAAPYAAYAKVALLFDRRPLPEPGIHPLACVAETAKIGAGCSVGAHAIIEAGVVIGENVTIGAGCYIGANTHVGAQCRLYPRVTLYHGVEIGQRVLLHSGAVIGADGFGLHKEQGEWISVPQVGGVKIADDVDIGANTTIDRGTIDNTIIGNGVKIDNQVQIGHNVVIGDHCAIAGCAAIAGSTKIGKHCIIGGGACIVGHITITDNVTIAGMAGVPGSIHQPGVYLSGTRAQPYAEWRKNTVHLHRISKVVDRVKKLEEVIARYEGQDESTGH